MKKNVLRFLALMLAVMMVLCACGNATPAETTAATNPPETNKPTSGVTDDKPAATISTNPPTNPPKDPAPHDAHCVCGGKAVAVGTHTECKTEEKWTLLTEDCLID